MIKENSDMIGKKLDNNGIIIDYNYSGNNPVALIKHNRNSYCIAYNITIKNNHISNFGFLKYYSSYVRVKYDYSRIINKPSVKTIKRVIER